MTDYPGAPIDQAILRKFTRRVADSMEPCEKPLTYDVAWEGNLLGERVDIVQTTQALYLAWGSWLRRSAVRVDLADIVWLLGTENGGQLVVMTRLALETSTLPWALVFEHPEQQRVATALLTQWIRLHPNHESGQETAGGTELTWWRQADD